MSEVPELAEAQYRRRGREVLAEVVFRPVAELVVALLLPLRVSPSAVVLANAVAGLGAAAAVAGGEPVVGALLLQVKIVLDNADGQLARAAGRTTALGRYLDTEADLVVNAALFTALAFAAGAPVLAVVAFVALTAVLSADFNEDVLYRQARGETVVTEPPAAGEGRLAAALSRAYRVVFAPQDRALQALSRRRLGRSLAAIADPDARRRVALAYHDRFTVTVLANLGLSTQLALLGVCLVAGAPVLFLWLAIGSTLLLPALQARRDLRARRMARGLSLARSRHAA